MYKENNETSRINEDIFLDDNQTGQIDDKILEQFPPEVDYMAPLEGKYLDVDGNEVQFINGQDYVLRDKKYILRNKGSADIPALNKKNKDAEVDFEGKIDMLVREIENSNQLRIDTTDFSGQWCGCTDILTWKRADGVFYIKMDQDADEDTIAFEKGARGYEKIKNAVGRRYMRYQDNVLNMLMVRKRSNIKEANREIGELKLNNLPE